MGTIRTAAVLGAGVMGAQIAAHLNNAGIKTYLFDIPAKEGPKNHIVNQALKNLRKLKPSPIGTKKNIKNIIACNYLEHCENLKNCDLIIEAITENMAIKQKLFETVTPHLNSTAIFATNSSGLSINQLCEVLPAELQSRFCGIHFFNPPRYMKLVEIIPSDKTDKTILPNLEKFLVSNLGKTAIYAKDTPNFIANRIGVFSMLATAYHAEQFDIGFDIADSLTGTKIGRPKSATFRTADVVGLDTFVHVVQTMKENCKTDPWVKYYESPEWLIHLINNKSLGQKTKKGIYYKQGKEILVYDRKTKEYQPSQHKIDDSVKHILKNKNWSEKLIQLQQNPHPQAQFLWACFRDVFHYCAQHCQSIAETVQDIDKAMQFGFGWEQGPFETWQAAGWQDILALVQQDIHDNKTMADISLPKWASENQRMGVYGPEGAYSPNQNSYVDLLDENIYKKQIKLNKNNKTILLDNSSVCLWQGDDKIAVLNFKTKMNTVTEGVLDGIVEAIKIVEKKSIGLVLHSESDNFCAGANLAMVEDFLKNKQYDKIEAITAKFQQASLALRYSQIPIVAAVKGLVLGGGCELMMHCDRTVAAFESYIGLVEVGVGILPAGAGSKEFAYRVSRDYPKTQRIEAMSKIFENIAMAKVAGNAMEAREFGYLTPADQIIMNSDELLYIAKSQCQFLVDSNYIPPLKPNHIEVLGINGQAVFKSMVANMLKGGFISEHDAHIANWVAKVLCGGDIDADSIVDEEWMLTAERHGMMALVQNEKSQARVMHMLETGKPLRN